MPLYLHGNEYHYRSLYRSYISIQYILLYELLFETKKIIEIEITPYNAHILVVDMEGELSS